MRNILTTCFSLSLAAAATAHAEVNESQMRSLENRVSALEQRKTANGMINPSGRPEVRDGADVFITGDFLYWQAHQNGMAYAVKSKGSDLYHSSTKEMDFRWDPGFRVGLGWNTPHDGWDIYANWTSFYTKANGKKGTKGSTIYPTFIDPNFIASYQDYTPSVAKAHWRLNLNMIDLEMGREFFVSKWLTLRPFVGLRTAWIHQRLDVEYKNMQTSNATNVNYETELKNKYWGIGVRPGLNTQWGLGCGFSIYGNSAISLLYGFFDLDQEQYAKPTSGALTKYIKNAHSYHVDRAIAEVQLGIRWEHMFANDHAHFSIQAGWENFVFFGQNQFDKFVNSDNYGRGVFVSNQGDLTTQGYTLSIRLDF